MIGTPRSRSRAVSTPHARSTLASTASTTSSPAAGRNVHRFDANSSTWPMHGSYAPSSEGIFERRCATAAGDTKSFVRKIGGDDASCVVVATDADGLARRLWSAEKAGVASEKNMRRERLCVARLLFLLWVCQRSLRSRAVGVER